MNPIAWVTRRSAHRNGSIVSVVTEDPLPSVGWGSKEEFLDLLREFTDDLRTEIEAAHNLANRANVALSRHKTDHLDAVSSDPDPGLAKVAVGPRHSTPRKAGMSMRKYRRAEDGKSAGTAESTRGSRDLETGRSLQEGGPVAEGDDQSEVPF